MRPFFRLVATRAISHRLAVGVLVSTLALLVVPIVPLVADADTPPVRVEVTAQPEAVTVGGNGSITLDLSNVSGRSFQADVSLTVTAEDGRVAYSKVWTDETLAARGRTATKLLTEQYTASAAEFPAGAYDVSVLVEDGEQVYLQETSAARITVEEIANPMPARRRAQLPQPTPTATPTEAPSPTATASPAPTQTPSATATETPTEPPSRRQPSPTPSPTPTPTASPAPSQPAEPIPGQTIQQMVDAAEPGSTVVVPAGTYRETVTITKPLTLQGSPGTVIDGEDRERWIVGAADDVTIAGFTFINSDQPQYHGGLSNDGHDNWTIRNNVFQEAGNAAIDIKQGSGHLIENNEVARSGNVGIRVESVGSATIRGNRTYGNNTKNLDPGWEAGGMKITGNYGGVHNLVIENNEAHENNGPGIWVDIDGDNVEIRDNRVHHNQRAGILYELSFNARIHGNVVYNNGSGFDAWGFGAGIVVQNSSGVEVFNNVLAWNADGITIISQNRGESRWNRVSGNNVHDNAIISDHDGSWNMYGLAWLEDWDGALATSSSNNHGANNLFWFTRSEGDELRFRWADEAFWTVGDFSASPGGQSSRNLTDAEKDKILASAGL